MSGEKTDYFYGVERSAADISWGPFARVAIGFESNKTQINRKTDSLLDVVGTIGGFFEALRVTGELLVGNYTRYTLKTFLALSLVRFVAS